MLAVVSVKQMQTVDALTPIFHFPCDSSSTPGRGGR